MQNEKIAVIALIVIIAGALSIYLVANNDVFENLFPPSGKDTGDANTIEDGDCVDLHYIGRYGSNDSVFDSSYESVDEKTGGNPLQIFIPSSTQTTPPEDYPEYSSAIIDGLMNQLVGLKLDETYVLDPISPEDAYGLSFDVGDTIDSIVFNQNIIHYTSFINQTLQVTQKTDNNIIMKWINPPEQKFSIPSIIIFGSLDLNDPDPSYDDVLKMGPPFAIWENSTEIIETTDENYVTITTPTSTENLVDNITQIPLDLMGGETLFIFPDATTVTYDDTLITFHLDPVEGKVYSYTEESMFGDINVELTVNTVTNDSVNISVFIVEYNQSQFYDINREMSFNRTFDYPRIYDMDIDFLQQALPQFEMDLQREGYSLSPLAGETLIFEVSVENIIKPSQEKS
ncbi:hypothetical protein B6U98_01440 [Thermoplasmatales archaeon ex4572_165]|nr:MAG: hypothetical protein B6U98_01440 [Thermoplasmatales archaeon ex4572_165]